MSIWFSPKTAAFSTATAPLSRIDPIPLPTTINWLEFSAAVLLIELTPGPNMLWLAGLSLAEGRRAGLAATLGIAIGLTLNAILAALGLVALISAEPRILVGLRWAGVAMMLWLAVQSWRAGSQDAPPAATGAGRHFASGLLVNLLNAKALVFFVVILPPFLGGRAPTLGEALALAAASVSIATAVHLAIVVGAARAHDWLSNPIVIRRVRRATALLMAAIALWLATQALGDG